MEAMGVDPALAAAASAEIALAEGLADAAALRGVLKSTHTAIDGSTAEQSQHCTAGKRHYQPLTNAAHLLWD